ncbi:glycoside hydrolase family 5 protein [uncultured Maribacter sp.]|uniref:glycoside hydrolase family 5 protein n=1 Tax=uncultured Maribacter sp. TaxID=431308 RepID=UPI0026326E58|nr:glycoside hydrolase family 5 protein [uncultured Maribacter sp.]
MGVKKNSTKQIGFYGVIRKNILFALIIGVVSFNTVSAQINADSFVVKKGTNVAYWLSQSDRRGIEREHFFIKADVEKIADMGFDHIRLPIDEEQMWDKNGNRHKKAFQLLENCIKWCEANDLRIIIDLHILRSHHFNAKKKPLWTDKTEQDKFLNLWRDLSMTLKKYPDHLVAYELMNEAVADNHESWNELLKKAFTVIRELEPKRTIVIGSNRWQSTDTFDALKVPLNDKNILLSFHFYEPFLFSHYSAKWTFLKDYKGPVHYPGVILSEEEYSVLPDVIKPEIKKWVNLKFNKEVLLEKWKKPILKAKELGLPLYCGEFGIIQNAPYLDKLKWYTDMVALFNETGIGYANWNYKSDNFGLIDYNNKADKKLITIVSNNK